MKEFSVDQSMGDDGFYTLHEAIIYESPRYKKTVVVPVGTRSDGATGAEDIVSRAWWVHDELCKDGVWGDGTVCTNWQASRVLSDILMDEGRPWRSKTWLIATFLFGGGKCRAKMW